MRDAPWSQVFKSNDAEIAYYALYSVLTKVFENHAPVIQKKVHGLYCSWRAPAILKLKTSRDYHLKKLKAVEMTMTGKCTDNIDNKTERTSR